LRLLRDGWSYKFQGAAKDLATAAVKADPPLRWGALVSPRLLATVQHLMHVTPRHAAPYLGLVVVPLALAGGVVALVRRAPAFLALPLFALCAAGIVYDLPYLHRLRPPTVFHYYLYDLLALPAALAAARGA